MGSESALTVARNAVLLVAGQAATTALAIVFSATLGRTLGPTDFGTYYLITTMAAFAYVFVEWGQPLLVIREAARAPRRAGELLGTAVVVRVAAAAVVALPVAAISLALGYGRHTTALAVFLIVAGLPFGIAQAYGMVFRARDRMGRDAAVSVCNKAVALALALPRRWPAWPRWPWPCSSTAAWDRHRCASPRSPRVSCSPPVRPSWP
jgi:O-antigen/teichoic acid export membrane protein